ncbi:unnamed protein product [Rangifer tarandus platyrhynchus]|uniref:Uncharacterized protein n=2 Tax=Rangifer tarandus platyrhynchus TaxID=3082113 RepID=A0ABN8XWL1_RANTA|nr:unnamed protein product [Rangifer tarandus platyrhynchus]
MALKADPRSPPRSSTKPLARTSRPSEVTLVLTPGPRRELRHFSSKSFRYCLTWGTRGRQPPPGCPGHAAMGPSPPAPAPAPTDLPGGAEATLPRARRESTLRTSSSCSAPSPASAPPASAASSGAGSGHS